MTSVYPRYSVWKDARSQTYEVVRWDSPRTMGPVQVNIRTPEKAIEALATWQDFAARAKGQP